MPGVKVSFHFESYSPDGASAPPRKLAWEKKSVRGGLADKELRETGAAAGKEEASEVAEAAHPLTFDRGSTIREKLLAPSHPGFSVLFMDQNLGDGIGTDIVQEAWARIPERMDSICVVGYSSEYNLRSYQDKARAANYTCLISKPTNRSEITSSALIGRIGSLIVERIKKAIALHKGTVPALEAESLEEETASSSAPKTIPGKPITPRDLRRRMGMGKEVDAHTLEDEDLGLGAEPDSVTTTVTRIEAKASAPLEPDTANSKMLSATSLAADPVAGAAESGFSKMTKERARRVDEARKKAQREQEAKAATLNAKFPTSGRRISAGGAAAAYLPHSEDKAAETETGLPRDATVAGLPKGAPKAKEDVEVDADDVRTPEPKSLLQRICCCCC